MIGVYCNQVSGIINLSREHHSSVDSLFFQFYEYIDANIDSHNCAFLFSSLSIMYKQITLSLAHKQSSI